MRWLVGLIGAYGILNASAAAQVPPAAEQLASATLWETPVWTQRANAGDFERAHASSFSGETVHVALDCLVQNTGAVACAPADGNHATARLVHAAMELSSKFRVSTTDSQGAPTAGRRVVLRLVFH